MPRRRQPRRRLGVEDLVAGLIELVHGPALAEPLGEFDGGLRRGLGLLQKPHHLAAGDGLDIGAARFERGSQGCFDGAQLRLTEAIACNVGSRRQRGQRQDTGDDLGFEFKRAAARDAGNVEARIGGETGPNTRRFGDAEFVIRGLQFAIIQQRDLHGGIHSQWTLEQSGDRFAGRGNVVIAAQRNGVHSQRGLCHVTDGIHALVAGKAGATAQQRCDKKRGADAAGGRTDGAHRTRKHEISPDRDDRSRTPQSRGHARLNR